MSAPRRTAMISSSPTCPWTMAFSSSSAKGMPERRLRLVAGSSIGRRSCANGERRSTIRQIVLALSLSGSARPHNVRGRMRRTTAMQKARPAFGDAELETLQKNTFGYFWDETNPENGLIADNTLAAGVPSSIAGVGMALSCYPVGVERARGCRLPRRAPGADHAAILRGERLRARCPTHWLPGLLLPLPRRRRPAASLEVRVVDDRHRHPARGGSVRPPPISTAPNPEEREIRELRRRSCIDGVDWRLGPERRRDRETRLAARARVHPLPLAGLQRSADPLRPRPRITRPIPFRKPAMRPGPRRTAGRSSTGTTSHGAPLFMHQLSHLWIDFRGIQDEFMRRRGIDYFENSRRADLRPAAVRDPQSPAIRRLRRQLLGHHRRNGPGPARRRVRGVERRFYDYKARGVPYGPDDGTLAPWAAAASLPFAPEIVRPTLRAFRRYIARRMPTVSCAASIRPFVAVRASWLGLAQSLRSRPGSRGADDRKPPLGADLAADAKVPCCGPRTHSGRFFRRVAGADRRVAEHAEEELTPHRSSFGLCGRRLALRRQAPPCGGEKETKEI